MGLQWLRNTTDSYEEMSFFLSVLLQYHQNQEKKKKHVHSHKTAAFLMQSLLLITNNHLDEVNGKEINEICYYAMLHASV